MAEVVVGVGAGVEPGEYDRLEGSLDGARAPSWRPPERSPTRAGSRGHVRSASPGRSLAPRLYVAVGLSGKFNHMVGVRGAGKILAINRDPEAKVFPSPTSGSSATGARWFRSSWRGSFRRVSDDVRV